MPRVLSLMSEVLFLMSEIPLCADYMDDEDEDEEEGARAGAVPPSTQQVTSLVLAVSGPGLQVKQLKSTSCSLFARPWLAWRCFRLGRGGWRRADAVPPSTQQVTSPPHTNSSFTALHARTVGPRGVRLLMSEAPV